MYEKIVHDDLLSALLDRERFSMLSEPKEEEGIIEGSVCEDEDIQALHVKAKFIDAESEKYEPFSEDIYGQIFTEQDVVPLMEGLVLKLLQHFPLREGRVQGTEGPKVYTSLSKKHHVRERMKLLVFREEEGLQDEILGEARITKVITDSSEARLLESGTRIHVRKQDKVITK